MLFFLSNPRLLRAASLSVNNLADTDDGTCDATHCTLREAINAANTNPGADTITFSVTGVISTTGLPALADDETVISGKIGPDVQNPDELNQHLHQQVTVTFAATRLGAGRPRYVLKQVPSWSETFAE